MPQMMPMSWVTLFITFSATLILFSTMNYYSHIPKTKTTKMDKITIKNMNWKW
uniref:ATP synthase complex subunit 8 n=1 Tax=Glyptotermes sp. 1 AB-2022a TaxID=2942715 RepID=A0A8X8M169_9NEOP|nr:ATP synthase F0 subunit 8 [Glyptotermes sp. 1 AB-2022a]